MRTEQAKAKVKLKHGDRTIELDALVDTGASISVMSKRLSGKMGCFHSVKPYELRTADKEGRLKINGYCRADIEFQGYEIPGGALIREEYLFTMALMLFTRIDGYSRYPPSGPTTSILPVIRFGLRPRVSRAYSPRLRCSGIGSLTVILSFNTPSCTSYLT